MSPAENNSGTQGSQEQQSRVNPQIIHGQPNKYNPKREANQQNKDEATGLTDEGLGQETSSSASGSVEPTVDNNDSGAV